MDGREEQGDCNTSREIGDVNISIRCVESDRNKRTRDHDNTRLKQKCETCVNHITLKVILIIDEMCILFIFKQSIICVKVKSLYQYILKHD